MIISGRFIEAFLNSKEATGQKSRHTKVNRNTESKNEQQEFYIHVFSKRFIQIFQMITELWHKQEW